MSFHCLFLFAKGYSFFRARESGRQADKKEKPLLLFLPGANSRFRANHMWLILPSRRTQDLWFYLSGMGDRFLASTCYSVWKITDCGLK